MITRSTAIAIVAGMIDAAVIVAEGELGDPMDSVDRAAALVDGAIAHVQAETIEQAEALVARRRDAEEGAPSS